MAHCLAGVISLSWAAEPLQLSWLNLRTRFLRLDIPIRTAARETVEIATDMLNADAYNE